MTEPFNMGDGVEKTRVILRGAQHGDASILVPTQELRGKRVIKFQNLLWLYQPPGEDATRFEIPVFRLEKGILDVPHSTPLEG
jgi:hypothetical protein